jgi:glycosyltransferase involved in cell wall biosynthesis
MRVLHAHLSQDFAGSERYAASLAAAQFKAGHAVRLVVRDTPHVPRWRAESGGADVLVLPRWAVGPLAGWVMRRLVVGFAPDVLHSHLGGASRLLAKVAQRVKRPHVATLHLRFKPKEHADCAAVIAIADWQRAEIPASFGGRVATVWNWVPEGMHQKRPRRSGELVFGSVGRLHPNKGMDVLIEAFRAAFGADERVRLVLIGEGAQRERLRELASDDPRIGLLGYKTNLKMEYAQLDVYVSASRFEPFGLTILEAMAAELPLVCTLTDGPRDFLKNQPVPVWWAEPDDVASLTRALRAAYDDGRQTARWEMSPFDSARAVREIETVYAAVRRNP